MLKGGVDDLKLTAADASVLSFVNGFGNRALFTGGCIAGKSGKGSFRSTHVLALITDLEGYQSQVTKRNSITGDGMSIGNSICFNAQETTFELEALPIEAFTKRLANIKAGVREDGSPMVYAHEALLYEPSTKVLTDPFKAMSGKTGTLKRVATPAGYGPLADGALDVGVYHLKTAAKDQSDFNAILARSVTDATEAGLITRAFLQNLSLNSQVNTAAIIQTLCGTRAIRTATQLTLGTDSQRVAANFANQRARFATDITDGAIWHALFQATEVPPDGRPKAAAFALTGGCVLKTFLTMQELLSVRKIKQDKGFKAYA